MVLVYITFDSTFSMLLCLKRGKGGNKSTLIVSFGNFVSATLDQKETLGKFVGFKIININVNNNLFIFRIFRLICLEYLFTEILG